MAECMNKFKPSSPSEMSSKREQMPPRQTASERSSKATAQNLKNNQCNSIEHAMQGDRTYGYECQRHATEGKELPKQNPCRVPSNNNPQSNSSYDKNMKMFSSLQSGNVSHSQNLRQACQAASRQACQAASRQQPLRNQIVPKVRASQCSMPMPSNMRSQQSVTQNLGAQTLKVSNLETLVIQPGSPTVIEVHSSKSKERFTMNSIDTDIKCTAEDEQEAVCQCHENVIKIVNEDDKSCNHVQSQGVSKRSSNSSTLNYETQQATINSNTSLLRSSSRMTSKRNIDQDESERRLSLSNNDNLNSEVAVACDSNEKSDKCPPSRTLSNNSQPNMKQGSKIWQSSSTNQTYENRNAYPTQSLKANSKQCSSNSNNMIPYAEYSNNENQNLPKKPSQTLKITNLDTVVIQPGSPTLIQVRQGRNQQEIDQDSLQNLDVELNNQCLDSHVSEYGIAPYGDGQAPKCLDYQQCQTACNLELKNKSIPKRSKQSVRYNAENENMYQMSNCSYQQEQPQSYQSPTPQQQYQNMSPPLQQKYHNTSPPPQQNYQVMNQHQNQGQHMTKKYQVPPQRQYRSPSPLPSKGKSRYHSPRQSPNCQCPVPPKHNLKHHQYSNHQVLRKSAFQQPLDRSDTQSMCIETQHQLPVQKPMVTHADSVTSGKSRNGPSNQYHTMQQYDQSYDCGFGDGSCSVYGETGQQDEVSNNPYYEDSQYGCCTYENNEQVFYDNSQAVNYNEKLYSAEGPTCRCNCGFQ